MLTGGNGGVVWSEQYVASEIGRLLVASAPLWMILIDIIRPHKQRQRPAWTTLWAADRLFRHPPPGGGRHS